MNQINHRLLALGLLALASVAQAATAGKATPWIGKWYGTLPNRAGVSEAFCKAHSLGTYQTTAGQVNLEVKSSNGITAKNLAFKDEVKNGLHFHNGTSMLSGTYAGKPWKTVVHYYVQALDHKSFTHGVWSTKDCKGFIIAGPIGGKH